MIDRRTRVTVRVTVRVRGLKLEVVWVRDGDMVRDRDRVRDRVRVRARVRVRVGS